MAALTTERDTRTESVSLLGRLLLEASNQAEARHRREAQEAGRRAEREADQERHRVEAAAVQRRLARAKEAVVPPTVVEPAAPKQEVVGLDPEIAASGTPHIRYRGPDVATETPISLDDVCRWMMDDPGRVVEGTHRVCRRGDDVWADALFVPEIEVAILSHGLGLGLLTAAQSEAAAESLDDEIATRASPPSDDREGFYGGLIWFVPLMAFLAATLKLSC